MTVYVLTVDGVDDVLVDVAEPVPWIVASELMFEALWGVRPRVAAVPRPELTVHVDAVLFDGAGNHHG